MKYKCDDCGEIFDEENCGTRHECVGEFWGAPAYKDFMVCPNCDSEYIDSIFRYAQILSIVFWESSSVLAAKSRL